MITDDLSNSSLYPGFPLGIRIAFDFLKKTDLVAAEAGKYLLEDGKSYALIQEYETKDEKEVGWEAHRKYIDLQYLVRGREQIGYAPIKNMKEGEYNPEKDFIPLSGAGSYLQMLPGNFMLLFPWDAHKPGLSCGGKEKVKKVVVKIAMEGV